MNIQYMKSTSTIMKYFMDLLWIYLENSGIYIIHLCYIYIQYVYIYIYMCIYKICGNPMMMLTKSDYLIMISNNYACGYV